MKRRKKTLGRISAAKNEHGCVVRFGAREVGEFRHSWPASGLDRLTGVGASFDRHGSLDDLWCMRRGKGSRRDRSCEQFDGPALLALTEDMEKACYKAKKMSPQSLLHSKFGGLGRCNKKRKRSRR